MKKLLRGFIVSFALFFIWPFFLYKKYGNKEYRLKGKTIIVSNHYATLDAFFIYLALKKKKIRFVTIKDVKTRCMPGFLAWLFDCLYIDYNSTNLTFFKECINILNNDGVICIYPEGVINPMKIGVFPFEGAFMYLAQKTGATILPLFVYPKFEFFKRSVVRIGDEITSEVYSRFEDRTQAINHVQNVVSGYSLETYS